MNSLICATFGSVMMNILYVIIAIVVLLTMVLIHELGHYIVGRKLGFKITEFSIGFGKALWQRKNKRGELISFRIFPLGGYCAFDGETEDDEPKKDDEKKKVLDLVQNTNSGEQPTNSELVEETQKDESENQKPEYEYNEKGRVIYKEDGKFNNMKPWKRMLVYVAGVTFNFLSAFLFSIIFLCVGGYDGYRVSPTNNYVVNYTVVATSQAGILQQNTLVYAINGTNINYAQGNVFNNLTNEDDTEIILTIDLNGEKVDVKIQKELRDVEQEDGSIKQESIYGISYSTVNIAYGFDDVLRDFIPFTFNLAFMVLEAFWWIISGQIAINQLGGPISTISQMTVVASYGLANFLYLLPLLAANLAIFNILPIPGLDGAHVIFTGIEWVRGKPIKRSVENAIHGWGILALFAFVIIIDVIHLITA